jgi:hypothetical protein
MHVYTTHLRLNSTYASTESYTTIGAGFTRVLCCHVKQVLSLDQEKRDRCGRMQGLNGQLNIKTWHVQGKRDGGTWYVSMGSANHQYIYRID